MLLRSRPARLRLRLKPRTAVRQAFPVVVFVSFFGLSACSTTQQPSSPALDEHVDTTNDPFENVNRVIWDFDIKADKYVLRPVAVAYRDNIPSVVRTSVSNVLRNMKQPLIMANDVLQLNPAHTSASFARFITNSIFGIGGLIDVATDLKIPYHDSDFGQTLGRWGIPAGPYIVLPILGPSDPRDAAGYGVDGWFDPVDFEFRQAHATYVNYSRAGLGILSDRSDHIDDLDELRRTSLDFYAAARSLYQQQRAAAVANAPYQPHEGVNPLQNTPPAGAAQPVAPQTNGTAAPSTPPLTNTGTAPGSSSTAP